MHCPSLRCGCKRTVTRDRCSSVPSDPPIGHLRRNRNWSKLKTASIFLLGSFTILRAALRHHRLTTKKAKEGTDHISQQTQDGLSSLFFKHTQRPRQMYKKRAMTFKRDHVMVNKYFITKIYTKEIAFHARKWLSISKWWSSRIQIQVHKLAGLQNNNIAGFFLLFQQMEKNEWEKLE